MGFAIWDLRFWIDVGGGRGWAVGDWLRCRRGDMVWHGLVVVTVLLPLASLTIDVPRYFTLRALAVGGGCRVRGQGALSGLCPLSEYERVAVALPTLGMIASLAVGTITNNMSNTHQRQAETVLDIATAYGYRFRPNEKPYYLAVVLGLQSSNPAKAQCANQSGAEQLLAKGGQQLANQATQRQALRCIGRALPVVNVTRAAGSNLLMTYAAGQRAKTYFKSGPASVGDMESSISMLLKSDELKLSEWTMESIAASMANLSDTLIEGFDQGAQDVGRAAGKATRKFLNFWRDATTPKR